MKRTLFCWACILFGLFMSSYAIARRVPAARFRVVDAIEVASLIALTCSAIVLCVAIFTNRWPLIVRMAVALFVPLLCFMVYSLPYGLSYSGSKHFMPHFDLLYLAIGLFVVAVGCLIKWLPRR